MDNVLLSLLIVAIALGSLGIVAIFLWELCYRLFQLRFKLRYGLRTLLIALTLVPPALWLVQRELLKYDEATSRYQDYLWADLAVDMIAIGCGLFIFAVAFLAVWAMRIDQHHAASKDSN